MEIKIKEIIAPFIGKDVLSISGDTLLDRNALKSSIYVHRMYARLSSQGFVVNDYGDINNFADLMDKLNFPKGSGTENNLVQGNTENHKTDSFTPGVGIDIEEIAAFPETNDYRTHEFFVNNFSPEEISHCILQSYPLASFAGLFAAKEAILKANNEIRNKPFNTISIQHTQKGKPFYGNMHISISHISTVAIAVAFLQPKNNIEKSINFIEKPVAQPNQHLAMIIAFIALIIAIITLVVEIKSH